MYILLSKEPVIIYRRGGMGGGGGGKGENCRWDHLIFGRTKGGISCNWEPKRGDHWKLWKDSEGGTTQIFLENEDMEGGRGGREKHQKLFGGPDHFSEVTFKGEIG